MKKKFFTMLLLLTVLSVPVTTTYNNEIFSPFSNRNYIIQRR